jgi:hypothetical protein
MRCSRCFAAFPWAAPDFVEEDAVAGTAAMAGALAAHATTAQASRRRDVDVDE